MKYFIYARKSTDDEGRQVLSIQAQLDELREIARKESLAVIKEFVEAQTAKEPGRPIFNDMMKAIEKGHAQGILAWHPDRLARNSIDGGRIIYDLDTGKMSALKFPTFWFENTPQGKFMLQIAFGQSKYYVDNLSENIKRGIRKKLRDGIYPNMPPPGYRNDPRTRLIVLDDEKAPLIRRMFEAYATGKYSGAEICHMAGEWGLVGFWGKPLVLARIHSILANPFYIGMFRFNGEMYEGKHPPIVSRELFARVQRVRKNRGKGRYARHSRFPFRGLIVCHECGCAITSDEQKGHNYYRCGKRRGPCSLKTMREEALTHLLRQSLRMVSIPDTHAENMLAEIERWKLTDSAKQTELVARQKADLSRTTEKLNRLLEVFIDGAISKDEFTELKEKLAHEKADLADSIAKLTGDGANRFKPVEDFITASRQAKYEAESDDLEELRNWHKRNGSNLIFSAQVLSERGAEDQTSAACAALISARESEGASVAPRGGSAARSAVPVFDNLNKIAAEAASRPAVSDFLPILPTAVPQPGPSIASLFRRSSPVLHVRFARPWEIVARRGANVDWRRG